MAAKPEPSVLGVSQAPDLDVDALGRVETVELVPGLELDGFSLSSLSLDGAEAGSVLLERVLLEDVSLRTA